MTTYPYERTHDTTTWERRFGIAAAVAVLLGVLALFVKTLLVSTFMQHSRIVPTALVTAAWWSFGAGAAFGLVWAIIYVRNARAHKATARR